MEHHGVQVVPRYRRPPLDGVPVVGRSPRPVELSVAFVRVVRDVDVDIAKLCVHVPVAADGAPDPRIVSIGACPTATYLNRDHSVVRVQVARDRAGVDVPLIVPRPHGNDRRASHVTCETCYAEADQAEAHRVVMLVADGVWSGRSGYAAVHRDALAVCGGNRELELDDACPAVTLAVLRGQPRDDSRLVRRLSRNMGSLPRRIVVVSPFQFDGDRIRQSRPVEPDPLVDFLGGAPPRRRQLDRYRGWSGRVYGLHWPVLGVAISAVAVLRRLWRRRGRRCRRDRRLGYRRSRQFRGGRRGSFCGRGQPSGCRRSSLCGSGLTGGNLGLTSFGGLSRFDGSGLTSFGGLTGRNDGLLRYRMSGSGSVGCTGRSRRVFADDLAELVPLAVVAVC